MQNIKIQIHCFFFLVLCFGFLANIRIKKIVLNIVQKKTNKKKKKKSKINCHSYCDKLSNKYKITTNDKIL